MGRVHVIRSRKLNRAKIMVIFILLAILWTPYLLRKLSVRSAPTPSGLKRAHPEPLNRSDADTRHTAWSALDDRQLTRLLTNSAPEPPPSRTPAA
jgi:hypothetical protein